MRPGTVDVAAGLIFHSGRLLLTQRLPGGHLGGLWEFPGGKREKGESWTGCLRRELREELGIEVKVALPEFADLDHAYPDRTVHLRFFRCRLWAGDPRPLGCQALAWVTSQELDRYAFPPADRRLLARLRNSAALWMMEGPDTA